MTPSKRIVRNIATETGATGKGMPARLPQADRTRVGAPQAQRDVSRGITDTSKGVEMNSAYKKLK